MPKALPASDLIRVAELIKLGAETARAFIETTPDGKGSDITEVADRIDAAAEELMAIGRSLDRKVS